MKTVYLNHNSEDEEHLTPPRRVSNLACQEGLGIMGITITHPTSLPHHKTPCSQINLTSHQTPIPRIRLLTPTHLQIRLSRIFQIRIKHQHTHHHTPLRRLTPPFPIPQIRIRITHHQIRGRLIHRRKHNPKHKLNNNTAHPPTPSTVHSPLHQ